ncbi:MAG: phytanoyl-CoA dioxygenase family protein [Chitinophagales bacterium]
MFQFPDKMKTVFQDERHQEEFEKNGFIALPFFNEGEIKELTELYHRLHPEDEKGFFPSTFSKDKAYRQTADKEIKRICERSIEKYCKDIKVVCGSFIVKNPGPESGMCVHQDMSLVDESRFTGINIWVPLCDLSIKNGAIFVLPGSHRLFPTYRGSSIPEFFSPVKEEDLLDYMQPLLLKAGEAVFFDQSIMHYSPPNYSDKLRIVTNTYFTHKDTEFRTYYWNKEEHGDAKLEAFAQDDDFMTNFEQFGENIQDRPKVGKSLGLVDYNFPKVDFDYIAERYERTNSRELIEGAKPKEKAQTEEPVIVDSNNKGLFSKLKSLFVE